MTMRLHSIASKSNRAKKKRLGRGNSSGDGNFSGRGMKGQKARSGGKGGLRYKGMKARVLSIPKIRGFRSHRESPEVVNVSDLEMKFEGGALITPQEIQAKGLTREKSSKVKILGNGNLTKSFTVKDCFVSESAKKKILDAKGTIT